jgi:uncharacterized repeat protein (TIGR02543 family)
MAWYRKTKPETYLNTSASNFTDSSKNWRKHSNIYRKTSGDETASLTAVPGRYTDSTRTWRRIKAIYRFTGSSWQKVFSKFAGQPYTTRNPEIRVTGYNGQQVDSYEMMGPGDDSIARGQTGTTYLWGWDATEYWENVSGSTATERFFYKSDVDALQDGVGNATEITNTESSGDKLRNANGYIDLHDGKFIFYRVRKINGSSIGQANSDGVYLVKQPCSILSISFYENNSIQAEVEKLIDFSVSNNWYDKPDYSKSYVAIHELDSQFQSPSSSTLKQKIFLQDSSGSGGDRYVSYTPNLSALNKYLYVQLVLKNSYNDSDNDNAPGFDVLDNIVALITGPVPKIVTAPVATSPAYNTLSVTDGVWDYTGSQYNPVSYSYLWQYNDQGSLWLNINQSRAASGSVLSNSLVLNTNFYSENAFPVRCVVTATNVNGSSTPSNSNSVMVTGGTAPSGGSASISGTGQIGSALTLTKTDATGIPSPTVSWKWRINDGGFSGGTFSGGAIVQNGGLTYTPTYTIDGWTNKVRAEVTWTNGVSPDQVVITNEIIIQPVYTVTWNVNGGDTTHASSTFTSGGSVTAPTPTRSGYTFLYWRDTISHDYTYSVNAGGTFYPPSQNITMYARWTPLQYTVTYDANGGSVSPSSASVNQGSSVTLPTPTRTNYTFDGWYTATTGGSLVGAGGNSYTPTSNITIYARWSAATYTITWNANGGTVTTTSSTFTSGNCVTAPTPTRTGDYLVGTWRDTPSGDFVYSVAPGGNFCPPDGNRTMYMRWITVTYGSCEYYTFTQSTSNSCSGFTLVTTTTTTYYFRRKVYHNNVDTGTWNYGCSSSSFSSSTNTSNSPTCGYVAPNPCPPVLSIRRCTSTDQAGGCCIPGSLSGCGGSGASSFSC